MQNPVKTDKEHWDTWPEQQKDRGPVMVKPGHCQPGGDLPVIFRAIGEQTAIILTRSLNKKGTYVTGEEQQDKNIWKLRPVNYVKRKTHLYKKMCTTLGLSEGGHTYSLQSDEDSITIFFS